jgi:hypothetical protein
MDIPKREGHIILAMVAVWVIALAFNIGASIGAQRYQQQAEDRALQLPDPYEVDDTYSWGDIEYVIFGETQE